MKIGIIGGGQLGMMMAQAAIKMGYEIHSLDPSSDCSIVRYSSKHYTCNFDDISTITRMCKCVDIVTYEFENIPVEVIEELEKKFDVYPSSKALKYSQNRLVEKNFVRELGVKTVNYFKISSKEDLVEKFSGKKSVLKTLTGGYDGKGQVVINDKVCEESLELANNYECILEEFIDFDYEASIIVTRSKKGDVVFFPLSVNTHKNNMLFKSEVSQQYNKELYDKAKSNARVIAEAIDLCGTLAIEFFIKGDRIIFNEMAPRPHNSGHYTIEACNVSQFENHINAVVGCEIIEPKLQYESIMINVVGEDSFIDFSVYDGYYHDYFKTEAKKMRKMGHIIFIDSNKDNLNLKVEKYLEDLK